MYNSDSMAVPKSRRTKSSRDRRRSHISLDSKKLVDCSNCDEKRLPHRACSECGYYKGEEVVSVKKDEKKEDSTGGFESPI